MSTQLAERSLGTTLEAVIIKGDLAQLTAEQRTNYYREVCESLNLNPFTRPFEYITLNGKLTLYARKDCTDQLRKLHHVSVSKIERERIDDLYAVTVYASDKSGRSDSAIGAVSVAGLKGEALANALMKAESKAKRRVTLSLCGLGWTDETEVDSIPGATTVVVDQTTGEVLDTVESIDDPEYQLYVDLCERAQKVEVEWENLTLGVSRERLRSAAKELHARLKQQAKQAA